MQTVYSYKAAVQAINDMIGGIEKTDWSAIAAELSKQLLWEFSADSYLGE